MLLLLVQQLLKIFFAEREKCPFPTNMTSITRGHTIYHLFGVRNARAGVGIVREREKKPLEQPISKFTPAMLVGFSILCQQMRHIGFPTHTHTHTNASQT